MLLKTILNNCQKFKSFVYGESRFAMHEGKKAIEVEVKPRKNSKAICSGCHKPAPGYDSLDERKFEFFSDSGVVGFVKFSDLISDSDNKRKSPFKKEYGGGYMREDVGSWCIKDSGFI